MEEVKSAAAQAPYAIEMLHITKRFPGIIANDDITLQLRKGEIHALLGENGAGKSFTLAAFWAGAFANAWPGIVLQLVLIPPVVAALKKAKLMPNE